jgi:uncharacterized protein YraI
MKYGVSSILLGLALAAVAPAALAQQLAFTAKMVNVRAGPDRTYPVVQVLAPSTQVIVQGCIADYRWCDVAIGYERGWVYAGNLLTTWGERMLPLPPLAPYVGITIAPFVIQEYWGLHYRSRPWYPDWHRWARPAPHFAPRPQPYHYPPPQVRPHGIYPAPGVRPGAPPSGAHLGGYPAPRVHPAPDRARPPQGGPHPGQAGPHPGQGAAHPGQGGRQHEGPRR